MAKSLQYAAVTHSGSVLEGLAQLTPPTSPGTDRSQKALRRPKTSADPRELLLEGDVVRQDV
jgi:hypothetical protein